MLQMINVPFLRKQSGIGILEYALLLVALVAAVLSAQVFLRRAVSYKWREAADVFGSGRQYAPAGEHRTTIVNK